jgi:hypothetical protein
MTDMTDFLRHVLGERADNPAFWAGVAYVCLVVLIIIALFGRPYPDDPED